MTKQLCLLLSCLLISCSSPKKIDSSTPQSKKEAPKQKANPAQSPTADKKVSQNLSEKVINFSCSKGKDVRIITVFKNGSGCTVVYRKFGQDSIIGNSTYGTQHCETISNNVQRNLEAAEYKCQ